MGKDKTNEHYFCEIEFGECLMQLTLKVQISKELLITAVVRNGMNFGLSLVAGKQIWG
jgi:hypothetical protein